MYQELKQEFIEWLDNLTYEEYVEFMERPCMLDIKIKVDDEILPF